MAASTDEAVHRLNRSIEFDRRLYAEDIAASVAWAEALVRAAVLTQGEGAAIASGLAAVRQEFEAGTFVVQPDDEDIHTAVERRLTELIGPVAGKLHTGRSRNDQVATDFRLWVMRHAEGLADDLVALVQALLERAESDLTVPMPGYTHLQHAQPVTWGHWCLAHAWALSRAAERFRRTAQCAAVMPLGSGALAGTSVAVDRGALAAALGFDRPSENSLDAVSDRDFAFEFLFAAATAGVALSRLAETLILFNTAEFGFISCHDSVTTGSSLMPHKRNPDPLELARGKAGRLIGNLAGLLATVKGLPSAYDKDLQEDKEPVFDSHDALALVVPALRAVVQTLEIHPERMLAQLEPELFAVDLVDELVARGVPFREAHGLVGQLVRVAQERGVRLDQTAPEVAAAIHPALPAAMAAAFDLRRSLARRGAVGGTGEAALREQVSDLRRRVALLHAEMR